MFHFPKNIKKAIVGIQSLKLTEEEKRLFQKHPPAGIILFTRNCQNEKQLKDLTNEIRDVLGFNCPILIDQEGGSVSRLKKPFFEEFSAPGTFKNVKDVYDNALKMSQQLKDLGITVNCTPLVDLLFEKTHHVIGNRSFGSDPDHVSDMASAVINAHFEVGIMPIFKHLPGHGRATVDSHENLPIVCEDYEILRELDFKAFRYTLEKSIAMPWGMTAHIVYEKIDSLKCATHSKIIIDQIIRKEIGFSGVLITDCLTMKALKGTYAERALCALENGCDFVLHCSGDFAQASEILQVI